MFRWPWIKEKREDSGKEEVKKSFSSVKNDINSLGKWVDFLNEKDSGMEDEIMGVKEEIASIKNDIEGLKNVVEALDKQVFKQLFKTERVKVVKQTGVQGVCLGVQTPVQTGVYGVLTNFSVMERAIVWVLLNTDLKLSYDDIAAMMGKSRATIRGQINSIKQKSEGMVEEVIENNGKKRVFIPDEIKEKMLKNVKVRGVISKKSSKNDEK